MSLLSITSKSLFKMNLYIFLNTTCFVSKLNPYATWRRFKMDIIRTKISASKPQCFIMLYVVLFILFSYLFNSFFFNLILEKKHRWVSFKWVKLIIHLNNKWENTAINPLCLLCCIANSYLLFICIMRVAYFN